MRKRNVRRINRSIGRTNPWVRHSGVTIQESKVTLLIIPIIYPVGSGTIDQKKTRVRNIRNNFGEREYRTGIRNRGGGRRSTIVDNCTTTTVRSRNGWRYR